MKIKKGTTSKLLRVFVQDNSVSTGAGLAGLTSGSSGLTAYYAREGSNATVAISLSGGTLGTWSSGGFIAVDGTNMPGLYEVGIPDAALATGANSVCLYLKGATNMAAVVKEVELVVIDDQDSVRMGLTALPNAAAGANGGLPLSVDSSGRVDVLKVNGTSQTARDIGASVLLSSGNGTGQLDFTSGVVKANVTQCAGGTVPAGAIPNAVAGAAGGLFIAGANAATSITTALTANIIGNITGNLSGSVASVTAGVTLAAAAVQAVWDALTANLITANSIGKRLADDIDATISSRAATGAQMDLTAGAVTSIWAKTLTALSAVPAVTGTVLDALAWVFSLARNKRIQTSTTETVYKDDGLTTLATSSKTDDGTTFTRAKYT